MNLPFDAQVHPVFHVSQLKPFTPQYTLVFSVFPHIVDLEQQGIEPMEILDMRLVKNGNSAITQVLIKWSGIPMESTIWEDFHVVRSRFPDDVAWGQASAQGGDVTHGGQVQSSEAAGL